MVHQGRPAAGDVDLPEGWSLSARSVAFFGQHTVPAFGNEIDLRGLTVPSNADIAERGQELLTLKAEEKFGS